MRIVPASIAAAVLSMAAVSPVLAQTAAPAKISVIHAGALLDKPGQAPRGASTIVVRNGKIESVRDGFVTPEAAGVAGAPVLDLR
ncbi:MAG: amidohydrolase family protein, partial [Caulobacteraceae bacterium]